MPMIESRNEECVRCGCYVIERDATSEWSEYDCPSCGNGWSWQRT